MHSRPETAKRLSETGAEVVSDLLNKWIESNSFSHTVHHQGAIWNIYHAAEADKLRTFLRKVQKLLATRGLYSRCVFTAEVISYQEHWKRSTKVES